MAAFTSRRGLAGFRPGSRVTFFQQSQKKVTKKKASHVRAASRCLALLAAFGALANSLRSDNVSALIRTLLRCSARPNGEGIPHGSSASRTSPERLVRFAHFAECWGCLIPLPSLLSRARHAVPLRPHPSLLTPHSSLLTPHSSLLTPHSSPLTPHPLQEGWHIKRYAQCCTSRCRSCGIATCSGRSGCWRRRWGACWLGRCCRWIGQWWPGFLPVCRC